MYFKDQPRYISDYFRLFSSPPREIAADSGTNHAESNTLLCCSAEVGLVPLHPPTPQRAPQPHNPGRTKKDTEPEEELGDGASEAGIDFWHKPIEEAKYDGTTYGHRTTDEEEGADNRNAHNMKGVC